MGDRWDETGTPRSNRRLHHTEVLNTGQESYYPGKFHKTWSLLEVGREGKGRRLMVS